MVFIRPTLVYFSFHTCHQFFHIFFLATIFFFSIFMPMFYIVALPTLIFTKVSLLTAWYSAISGGEPDGCVTGTDRGGSCLLCLNVVASLASVVLICSFSSLCLNKNEVWNYRSYLRSNLILMCKTATIECSPAVIVVERAQRSKPH